MTVLKYFMIFSLCNCHKNVQVHRRKTWGTVAFCTFLEMSHGLPFVRSVEQSCLMMTITNICNRHVKLWAFLRLIKYIINMIEKKNEKTTCG